ncbi:MAG TPA: isochorismatase family protein [Stellaceae bacterium]|jgi:nicotinamidase-related amidase|nr:isochorismatase family protein [Stellaceae bacterium]
MTEPIWNKFLTERDKVFHEGRGHSARQGFGKRPALLIIDVNYAFCGDKREPIMESVKRWPTSCGEDAWDALPVLVRVIETARAQGVPVIYTTGISREDKWDMGSWRFKHARPGAAQAAAPSARESNHDGNEIMPQIAPGPRDIVVPKQKPSGFHGTNLLSYLTMLGCDSVIVAGTTTSGCVRATVLDGFSYNFRAAVIEDGCFDRAQASHALNLFDMQAKYADVVSSAEVIAFLTSLPAQQYDLPPGPR